MNTLYTSDFYKVCFNRISMKLEKRDFNLAKTEV